MVLPGGGAGESIYAAQPLFERHGMHSLRVDGSPDENRRHTKDIGYRCCLPALAGFAALKLHRTPGSTPRARALCTPDALGEAVDPSEAG